MGGYICGCVLLCINHPFKSGFQKKEHFVGQEKYVPIKKKRMGAEDFATGMLSFFAGGGGVGGGDIQTEKSVRWMVRS